MLIEKYRTERTFPIFNLHFSTAINQVLHEFWLRRFDGSHQRRGFIQCARFHVGTAFKQVLDHILNAGVTREVQRRPLEVVCRVNVRSVVINIRAVLKLTETHCLVDICKFIYMCNRVFGYNLRYCVFGQITFNLLS